VKRRPVVASLPRRTVRPTDKKLSLSNKLTTTTNRSKALTEWRSPCRRQPAAAGWASAPDRQAGRPCVGVTGCGKTTPPGHWRPCYVNERGNADKAAHRRVDVISAYSAATSFFDLPPTTTINETTTGGKQDDRGGLGSAFLINNPIRGGGGGEAGGCHSGALVNHVRPPRPRSEQI